MEKIDGNEETETGSERKRLTETGNRKRARKMSGRKGL